MYYMLLDGRIHLPLTNRQSLKLYAYLRAELCREYTWLYQTLGSRESLQSTTTVYFSWSLIGLVSGVVGSIEPSPSLRGGKPGGKFTFLTSECSLLSLSKSNVCASVNFSEGV